LEWPLHGYLEPAVETDWKGAVSVSSMSDIKRGRAAFALAAILSADLIFRYLFLPEQVGGMEDAAVWRPLVDSFWRKLELNRGLLLPYEYESTRYLWLASSVFVAHFLENCLGTLGFYLLCSSLFVSTSFFLGLLITRSLTFAATLAFMFAFGTQLNYLHTYGTLIAKYLFLIYASINFSIASLLVLGRITGARWWAAFVVSLVIVALSNDIWLNYAAGIVLAGVFGLLWARRHGNEAVYNCSRSIVVATLGVLGCYLAIRLRYFHQYLTPGAEEEFIFTYRSGTLIVEDVIANFFTLLYMTLSNYLPSFVSSSNSLTYLDSQIIIAEQHGYHAAKGHLIVMSHHFLWRFYAGVGVTLFLSLMGWAMFSAWRKPEAIYAVIAVLALMVIAGFATHLMIKMRPYNTVPALPYKVIVSVTAWTVLVAYLTAMSAAWLRSRFAHHMLVTGVWACVFVAALTRPGMQARLLEQVGLVGRGDPLAKLAHWLQLTW